MAFVFIESTLCRHLQQLGLFRRKAQCDVLQEQVNLYGMLHGYKIHAFGMYAVWFGSVVLLSEAVAHVAHYLTTKLPDAFSSFSDLDVYRIFLISYLRDPDSMITR